MKYKFALLHARLFWLTKILSLCARINMHAGENAASSNTNPGFDFMKVSLMVIGS